MRVHARRLAPAVLLGLAVLAPSRPLAAQPLEADVDEALTLSGVRQTLERLPRHLQAELRRRQAQLAPADFSALTRIVARTYLPATAIAGVRAAFASPESADRLPAVLETLRAPLIRRLALVEVRAPVVESREEIHGFSLDLKRRPPAPGRLALLERRDAIVGGAALAIEVAVAMDRAVLELRNWRRPAEHRLRPDDIQARLAAAREQYRRAMRDGQMTAALFAYRAVADADLERYVAALESEPDRWFMQGVRARLVTELADASDRASAEILRIFGPR
ncbi:MAG: hypothetical protein HY294_16645 [Candidatus Rokubacteria bacterium]|nr:hypothetical protein [Candidatus Rokubacteria bacterium]MBI3827621.1 hypothetical protein [Candidatus Rokubacteria bacterium]